MLDQVYPKSDHMNGLICLSPLPSKSKKNSNKRKFILDQENMRQDADMPEAVWDPSVFENSKAHRGVGADEAKSEVDLATVKRETMEYIPVWACPTQFYSTSPVDELFNSLLVSVSKFSKDYSISSEDFSVELSVIKEESKVQMIASILKDNETSSEDSSVHVVQFNKLSGDKFVFNKIYNQIREYFGGHANIIPSSDEDPQV